MGLFSGAISMARFQTEPLGEEDIQSFIYSRVQDFSFREDNDNITEMNVGWVAAHRPFDDTFSPDDIFFSDYVLLGIRVETRKVPAALLKKFYLQQEASLLQEMNKKALTRRERKLLKERVHQGLLSKTIPVPKMYEMVWHPVQGRLFFLATQVKAIEIFENIFAKTFDVRPVPVVPFNLALSLFNDSEDIISKIDGLRPEVLV